MKTSVQEGATLTITAPVGGTTAGNIYVNGDFAGVALSTAAAGSAAVLELGTGVYTFPKATAEAWSLGAKLYWDAANARLTTTASGNTLVANAFKAALAADTKGVARMRPFAG
jgi:predicted RecA/RadA family phage recombinase